MTQRVRVVPWMKEDLAAGRGWDGRSGLAEWADDWCAMIKAKGFRYFVGGGFSSRWSAYYDATPIYKLTYPTTTFGAGQTITESGSGAWSGTVARVEWDNQHLYVRLQDDALDPPVLLWSDGFESGDRTAWGAYGTYGYSVVQAASAHDGGYGLIHQGGGWCRHDFAQENAVAWQGWVNPDYCDAGVEVGSQYRVMRLANASKVAAEVFWEVTSGEGYNVQGKFGLRYWDNTQNLVSTLGTMSPTTGDWYHVRVELTTGSQSGSVRLLVDDVEVLSVSGIRNDQCAPTQAWQIMQRISGNKNHWQRVDTFELYRLQSRPPAVGDTFDNGSGTSATLTGVTRQIMQGSAVWSGTNDVILAAAAKHGLGCYVNVFNFECGFQAWNGLHLWHDWNTGTNHWDDVSWEGPQHQDETFADELMSYGDAFAGFVASEIWRWRQGMADFYGALRDYTGRPLVAPLTVVNGWWFQTEFQATPRCVSAPEVYDYHVLPSQELPVSPEDWAVAFKAAIDTMVTEPLWDAEQGLCLQCPVWSGGQISRELMEYAWSKGVRGTFLLYNEGETFALD